VWGQVKQWYIQDFERYSLSCFDKKKSPLLPVWNCLMEHENIFSAWALNFRKVGKTFDLLCNGYNFENHEKSSTNRT